MIGRQIQQHPDVRVRKAVVDAPTFTTGTYDVGGAQ